MIPAMLNPDATQIKAAGGLLINPVEDSDFIEVLLIFRNGVWDLPKGKLEEGESIPKCAVREVSEEVGSPVEPHILADLGTTRHTYTVDDHLIEKETFWFLMHLQDHLDEFTPQTSEGITDVRWVPAKEAISKVGFQNLEQVVRRFLENRNNLRKVELDHTD